MDEPSGLSQAARAVRHLRLSETRVAAAMLLENGTEESQKLVRARSELFGAPISQLVSTNTDNESQSVLVPVGQGV